jgi:hypothetical protein
VVIRANITKETKIGMVLRNEIQRRFEGLSIERLGIYQAIRERFD